MHAVTNLYKFSTAGLALKILCLVILWSATGCAAAADKPPALLDREHSLVDRIWDVRSGKFITRAQLFARLLESEYILLGETHDNRRHHAIQAQVIDSLHEAQSTASVSFEMINDAQGEALRAREISTPDELIEVLRGIEDKWPYTRDYRTVFESVLRAGFALRAANLRLDTIRRIARQGETALPHNIQAHLKQAQFSAQQQRAQLDDIVSAHCDMLPANATQPMVTVQRVRDAVMSLSMLESPAQVKVLIAGAGHVRKDIGVPFYLLSHGGNVRSLALGLIEVSPDLDKPQAYSERWGGAALPFDYVWFTPRAERGDPCAALRENMKR